MSIKLEKTKSGWTASGSGWTAVAESDNGIRLVLKFGKIISKTEIYFFEKVKGVEFFLNMFEENMEVNKKQK